MLPRLCLSIAVSNESTLAGRQRLPAAALLSHHPFAQLFKDQHSQGEGDHEQPTASLIVRLESIRGCISELVSNKGGTVPA